jgi:deazaflavin-dependent oxidoreductase (nitroreductase family)
MDESIQQALERDRTIDITTTGRKTGQPRRTEIWFHNVEGRLYITGTPGRRDWYANLLAHPEFTFHLKQSVRTDLPARATAVLDKAQRREIMAAIHQKLSGKRDLEAWVEGSPLVAVELLIEESSSGCATRPCIARKAREPYGAGTMAP